MHFWYFEVRSRIPISVTTNRYLFKDKHVEIACEWGALSRHVKTRRTEAKIFLADCLAIGRQVNRYRRPKHSLWLNKRCIWNSKAKIVKISTHQRYKRFHRRNTSLHHCSTVASCWTDRITCVRKLDNIVWSDASWDIWNSPPLYVCISPHLPRFQVWPSKSRLFRSQSIDSERKQKNIQATT